MTGKFPNTCKLNVYIIYQSEGKSQKKFKKIHRTNENKVIMYQNMWDTIHIVLKENFIW